MFVNFDFVLVFFLDVFNLSIFIPVTRQTMHGYIRYYFIAILHCERVNYLSDALFSSSSCLVISQNVNTLSRSNWKKFLSSLSRSSSFFILDENPSSCSLDISAMDTPSVIPALVRPPLFPFDFFFGAFRCLKPIKKRNGWITYEFGIYNYEFIVYLPYLKNCILLL